ncbi:MAG: hypothetical protein QOC85_3449 [Streptomyces sp.]|nr:hypothetical protein [Streptomyces sp.]
MLLERDNDVSKVNAALSAATGGHGRMVIVRGGLGTGKSELLETIGELGAAREVLTLRAQAAATEHDFAFGVVRQLIEPVLTRVPAEQAERWFQGTAHGARLILTEDASAGHDAPWPAEKLNLALTGLTTLVANMSRDSTVLILVDDLHWADAESLRMLWHLTRVLPIRRILVVCTVLTGDVRAERPLVQELLSLAGHTVSPENLSRDATRSLTEEYLSAPADDDFVSACHERSGGNPLFLTAILAEALFHGLKPSAQHAADAVALRPSLLRQRLPAFLESLPGHIRRTAFAMTVLDENTSPQLLDGLAELDAVRRAEALRVLREVGLITDCAHPVFAHSVVRDAVEESMPPAERAAMRAVAAELLHRSGHPVEQAAEHLMDVVTPQDRDVLRILRTAADSAMRRGAPRDAARFLRRALLDSSSSDPERARLLIDLTTVERSFATVASVRHIMEAVPLLDTPREQAAAVARIGPVLMAPAAFPVDDMVRRVSADLAASGTTDGVDRELALRLEARERFFTAQDPARVRSAVGRLADLVPEPPMDSVGERELLTVLIHTATMANAVPATAVAHLATRLLEHEPPTPTQVHTALPLAVNVLAAADRTEGVAAWLDEAHRIAESRRSDVEQTVIRAEQALVALSVGDMADARAKARQADALSDTELGGPPAVCAAILAIVALQTAQPERAERLLSRHRLGAENEHLAALLAVAKGSLASRAGDTRGALNHFLVAGHRMEQIGWRNPAVLPWASYAALMHQRLGDTATAVDLSRQEVAQARAWGAPSSLGRSLVVQGRLTPGRHGTELLEEAVQLLEPNPNRYELCLALFALGRRLGPRRAQGRALLRRALDLSAECGAPWVQAAVESHLGQNAPSRNANSPALTPSENKVAHLAASGLSNQEISGELSISCRMVEKHLTNCYRKMGIKSRRDLESALRNTDPVNAT